MKLDGDLNVQFASTLQDFTFSSKMASFVRIIVLMWADIFALYAIWVMMTYLTNVWKLNLTHAAAIVNIWGGVAAILPLPIAFLADTFMGHFSVLLLSSISYSVGLGLLSMSTPPVTGGNCTAYRPECIGDSQKILFYTALALIAVGLSGHMVSLGPFLGAQSENGDGDGQGRQFFGFFFVVLAMIAGIIALTYVKPWSIRFGVPAICTVVATLLFTTGICSYIYPHPEGSPITTLFRVFIASTSKLFLRSPADSDQFYEHPGIDYRLDHTHGLSLLDKAAVIKPTPALEQQEMNRWGLCTVTEVEETKITIRMIPMWMTLILCGVVSSIGNTYFIEQASKMNPKVGRLKIPLQILLSVYDSSKSQSAVYFFQFALCYRALVGSKRYAAPIGIAVAMICSILCCITAAKVENRRLNVVRTHGLVDKPDQRIPMSMFWLVPQFILLGALDGISDYAIASFFSNQAPPSMKNYLVHFTTAVKGLGIMASVVTVYLAGKFSEKGGKLNWFQDTLNKSRLDKYYWLLAAMSAVNLGLFILVAVFYPYRENDDEDGEAPEFEESDDPFGGNTQCCCCVCG